jgi:hypothetical protein
MKTQGYGCIIFTASTAAFYSKLGQEKYNAAKPALLDLSKALFIDGASKKVYSYVLAPIANSHLTENIFDEDNLKGTTSKFFVPLVIKLYDEHSHESGRIFEMDASWFAKLRTLCSRGVAFGVKEPVSTERIIQHWDDYSDFSPSEPVEDINSTFAAINKSIGLELIAITRK